MTGKNKKTKNHTPLFQACFFETLEGLRQIVVFMRGKLQNVSDMIKQLNASMIIALKTSSKSDYSFSPTFIETWK